MRGRGFVLLSLLLIPPALAGLAAAGFVAVGYWNFHSREKEIIARMDQYYLSLTRPARDEYLLESDETFEVPYMASKLSVAAEPTRFYDAQDKLLGEFASEKGVAVSDPADLPEFLKRALVATEDGTFYKHGGFNWRATGRAILYDLRHMRAAQGGSTITQQLAKMMFTTRKKTVGRKIFELFCAYTLERKFTKDQILLMYFNFAYFGHGCFGVEQASRYYFDKPAKALELGEAAMLVGVIASPNKYSPYENLELSQARHRTVLLRMGKLGFVPRSSTERLSREFWEDMSRRARKPEVSFWRMRVNEAPYAIEYLRRELLKDFSKERLLKGGLRIYTTFDLEAQRAAQDALQAVLRAENKPDPKKPEAAPAPIEGSLAAIRPSDGAVLALVGGSGFDFQNQLHRAVDSRRLIGSSVKPFVWAAAFESGKNRPDDEFNDAPVKFSLPGGRKWNPRNYGDKYLGKVTLRLALHKSLNSVAIQLLKSLSLNDVISLLSNASGLPRERFPRNLSLALGTVEMSALELSRSYAVFASGGKSVEPYFLRRVEDRDGKIVLTPPARPEPSVVMSTATAADVVDVMRGVLGPEGSAYGAVLKTGFNIPAAGKTGTTNEYRDAWFAGVTPDLAAAVWMGHDDMRLPLGEGKAGGAISAPAWMSFVKAYYRNRPTRDFEALTVKK
jgi:penicillin-binding protein 1A